MWGQVALGLLLGGWAHPLRACGAWAMP